MKKLFFSVSLLAIFACKENTKTSDTVESSSAPVETTAVENKNKPTEEVTTNTSSEVESIQKKQFDGRDLLLTKANVVGSILSVEIQLSNPDQRMTSFMIPLDEINYIDDSTVKKSGLLKDDSGVYMASPITSTKKQLSVSGAEKNFIMNLKFPAPSPETKTVSINIPKFGSFDGVPVNR